MELQTVHRRVREARAETGLSQKAFAQKVGVAREVLARWENGETKRPDVAKLSKATGKPVHTLPTNRTPAKAGVLLFQRDESSGIKMHP